MEELFDVILIEEFSLLQRERGALEVDAGDPFFPNSERKSDGLGLDFCATFSDVADLSVADFSTMLFNL